MIQRLVRRSFPAVQFYHGRTLVDENRVFSNTNSLALVLSPQQLFLRSEKEIAEQAKQSTHDEQVRLLKKLEQRTAPHEEVAPERSGNYMYFSVTEPFFTLKRRAILTGDKLGEAETVFSSLDLPEIKRNRETAAAIGTPIVRLSDDHQRALYIADVNLNERPVLGLKDLRMGKVLETIANVCGAEWSSDGKSVYYTQPDALNRPNVVKKHIIGTDPTRDTVLFTEDDESFYMDLSQTKDKKYMIVNTNSKTTTGLWVVDRETGQTRSVVPKSQGVRYFLEHNRGYFYLVTNQDRCLDFKVMRVPVGQSLPFAQDFVPYVSGHSIEEIDMFNQHLVIYYRVNGLPSIKVYTLKSGEFHTVPLPFSEGVYSLLPGVNLEYNAQKVRLEYSSPVTYSQTLECDLNTRKISVLKTTVLDGPAIHKSRFAVKRVEVPSYDGQLVPLTLFHDSKLTKDRSNRVILKGYGAYGTFSDNQFKLAELTAVEEGWTIATAHVRGDAEKGREWHEAAKFERKRNSFEDFVSCAAYLIAEGYTQPKYMAAWGASAGGLLVAQTINKRPDLFRAAVLEVPFVDILSLMLDETQALTLPEREEWGDPLHDPKIFDEIRSYSPYENLWHTEYPAMYITAGLRDPRVPFWSIAKYVKRLRQRKMPSAHAYLCKDDVFLEVEDSGHFGGGDKLKEEALMWAFLNKLIPPLHLSVG